MPEIHEVALVDLDLQCRTWADIDATSDKVFLGISYTFCTCKVYTHFLHALFVYSFFLYEIF